MSACCSVTAQHLLVYGTAAWQTSVWSGRARAALVPPGLGAGSEAAAALWACGLGRCSQAVCPAGWQEWAAGEADSGRSSWAQAWP